MRKQQKIFPYILIPFAMILLFMFVWLPMLAGINISLKNYIVTKPADTIEWIGLKNYIKFFNDTNLRRSILNTLYIVITMNILVFFGSIIVALVLNRLKKFRTILLVILILPWALPSVVNGFLWANLFNPSFGGINGILYQLGFIDEYIVFTSNPFVTLNIGILAIVWKRLPFSIILVLAALQAIPEELYEASQLDGASFLKSFLHITLPIIKPTIAIILSLASINALNAFDEFYILSQFRSSTRTIAMEAYWKAFRFGDLGYGTAISFILLITGAVFAIVYVNNLYRELEL